MIEGLLQPTHLVVILAAALFSSAPRSYLTWEKGLRKVSVTLRAG
jgi:hypothetical protein